MDGFDDLLSSSSHNFENNPFASPFDKPRSSSPDPWSTFGQQQQDHDAIVDRFEADSESSAEHALEDNTEVSSVDDEERVNGHEVHEQEDHSLQSPGFRESVPAADDAVSQAFPEPVHAGRHSPPTTEAEDEPKESSDAPSSTRTPTLSSPQLSVGEPGQESNTTLKTPSSSSNRFVSPLDYPSPGISQTFASLALGGESIGGWQEDVQTGYASSVTNDSEHLKQDISEVMESRTLSESIEENPPASKADSISQPLFTITVEDPQKVGDPIRSYILYTVHTKTISPLFVKPSFSVLRRYSDFLWLYETLSINNPGVIVPPVPEKNPFGRFDNLFVQQRRLALETCIQKIANHPILAKDPDLKLFLESDNFALDIKHRKTEQERGGIISSIGQTITGPRFYEVDDWFDRKKAYLDATELQLKGLVKAIDSVSKQREDLAVAIGEFAVTIGELSESDLSKQLCHSLSVLSDVEKKAQDLQHIQAQEDTITFMTTAEEYSRVIGSVRVAFASRVRCHAQWQNAESELRRIKQAHEKARSQGRIPQERIGRSLAQIADAERKALDAKHDFDRCSKLVKIELARFEEERIGDFKIALETFLDGMIQRQKELIITWERYQELLLKKVNAKPQVQESQGQPATA